MEKEKSLKQQIADVKRKEYKQPLKKYEELPPEVQRVLKSSNKDYKNIQLNQGQINMIKGSLKRLVKGMGSNLIMGCKGIECPNSMTCPLYKLEIAPVAELCPIEEEIVINLRNEYTKAVCEMIGKVEQELNIVHKNSISELIESELMDMRAQGYIQKHGVFEMAPSMVTKEGDLIEDMRPSIAFEVKDRVKRRKDRIMQSLMITEEMDFKYKKKGKKDGHEGIVAAFNMLVNAFNDSLEKNNVLKAKQSYEKVKEIQHEIVDEG